MSVDRLPFLLARRPDQVVDYADYIIAGNGLLVALSSIGVAMVGAAFVVRALTPDGQDRNSLGGDQDRRPAPSADPGGSTGGLAPDDE